jgi:hypothetical protein
MINEEWEMKKTVMAIALVLLATAGVFAQASVAGKTYYYKYVGNAGD